MRGAEVSNQGMWGDIESCCEYKHLGAPIVALIFDKERATRAVLSFLRDTKVGQMVTLPPRGEESNGNAGGVGGETRVGAPERLSIFGCLFPLSCFPLRRPLGIGDSVPNPDNRMSHGISKDR